MSLTNEIFYEVKHIKKISDMFLIFSNKYITEYYDEDINYIVFVFKDLFEITLDQASNVFLESSFVELPQIYNIFSIIDGNNTKVYITFDINNNHSISPKEDIFIDGIKSIFIFNKKLSLSEIVAFLEQDSEMITVSNVIIGKNKSIIVMIYYITNLNN